MPSLSCIQIELATTLNRMRSFAPWFACSLAPEGGPGDGWLSTMDWFRPEHLDALTPPLQARLNTNQSAILASALLQQYQFPVLFSAVLAYLIDHRVLSLNPQRVWMPNNDEQCALRLNGHSFTALAGDTACQGAQIAVVANRAQLRQALRESVESHLEMPVTALATYFGCRERTLWATAADRCAAIVVSNIQDLQPAISAAAINDELNYIVRQPGTRLFEKRACLMTIRAGQQQRHYSKRHSCCFAYRCSGKEACASCPRRSERDQRERFQQILLRR